MSFLPNGGTILLFYIILLSLSFSPNSSRRPRLHRLYAKEVARPVFFPFKSVDKLAISSPRILNGGRWRAGEREREIKRNLERALEFLRGRDFSWVVAPTTSGATRPWPAATNPPPNPGAFSLSFSSNLCTSRPATLCPSIFGPRFRFHLCRVLRPLVKEDV